MVSISTIRAIGLTIGPFFLPKIITYIRTLRVKSHTSPLPIQPLPKAATHALNILFVSAVLALISTLPTFNPENIFSITSSRLQTANDVIFTRLAAIRGTGGLTPNDETLRPKLASLDSRLLYLTYGPEIVTHCPFCMSDEPTSYLWYALPKLLLPHALHLFAIGLATSTLVGGQCSNKWRTMGSALGVIAASLEIFLYGSYEWKKNARALRPDEYVLFYWNMRIARGVMILVCDLILAAALYLSSTNRMFVTPPTVAERTESALRTLEQARGKTYALGIIRNAVVRDEGLRRRGEAYWIKEGKIMGEIMDEREVVEGVRSALTSRVQVGKIEEEARKFADGLIPLPAQTQEAVPTI